MKHPLTTLYGKQHWPQCMLFFQVLYGISIKHVSGRAMLLAYV
jgi:hypothetical protein